MLNNFDIVAAVGGSFKALVKEFVATTDSNGNLMIGFTSIVDNAKCRGIEILRHQGVGRPQHPGSIPRHDH